MNKQETDHFNKMAELWSNEPAALDRARSQFSLLEDHVSLHPGLTCLDVGGGVGLLSLLVAEKCGRVTVADLSEGMINQLGEKIKGAGTKNVEALLTDVGENIPDGGPYGLVYAFMSFHHIRDTERALANLAASQKSGGALLIVDLDTEDGSFHSHINGFDGHNGFDRGALSALAEAAGYAVVSVDTAMTMDRGERKYPLFALLCEKI